MIQHPHPIALIRATLSIAVDIVVAATSTGSRRHALLPLAYTHRTSRRGTGRSLAWASLPLQETSERQKGLQYIETKDCWKTLGQEMESRGRGGRPSLSRLRVELRRKGRK